MLLIISLCLLCGISSVVSFGPYRYEIPNGDHVAHPCMPNLMWDGVGHMRASGGGPRNQFGTDFHNNNKTWTYDLCMKDSDQDGWTNGQELGDPNCVWKKGQIPQQVVNITHPGVCTPFYSPRCKDMNKWVDCTSKEFECAALNTPDIQNMTLRFNKTRVPADETSYMCMIFDVPSDKDYHMMAYKPEIDNANVMHHIVIYGCDDTEEEIPTEAYKCDMNAGHNCKTTIGLWTLGVAGNCMSEKFGMLFGKNKYKRIALEFHWNNPHREANWFDSSGITMYYTSKLRPNNGAVMTTGQMFLEIPPGKPSTTFTSVASSACTSSNLNATIYVTSAINHMHYLGKAQSIEQRRKGDTVRYITNEPDYSYDDPKFYNFDEPLEIQPGDELITTCTYSSLYSNRWVYFGEATSDEMCFGLIWFYPAEAVLDPLMVSWKSVPLCAPGKVSIPVNGCDWVHFIYGQDPGVMAAWGKVWANCHSGGQCHKDCRNAVLDAKQHPCLRGGDVTDYVESLFEHSREGLLSLRKLNMCSVNRDDAYYPTAGAGSPSGILVIVIAGFLLGARSV